MANPTTNYGFVMPTSTDLVTDLPADFGVFGQAVDTQMLTNANAAIAKTIVDAKGDIIAATAADTVSRLAVGANNTVLTADSAEATGVKWATPAAGGLTLITAQTIGTAVSSIAVTSVFSSTYDNYKIMISGGTSSANNVLYLQLGSTVTGYYAGYTRVTYSTGAASLVADNNGTNFTRIGASNTNGMHSNFDILAPNLAKNTFVGGFFIDNATASSAGSFGGFLNDTTAYTGFTILMNTGNLTGGTIRVYGYKNS